MSDAHNSKLPAAQAEKEEGAAATAAAATAAKQAGDEEEQRELRDDDAEDDKKDAFIDLNNPDIEIYDESKAPPINDDDDDDDAKSEDFVTVDDENEQRADPLVDKTPAREDAFRVFAQELSFLKSQEKKAKTDETDDGEAEKDETSNKTAMSTIVGPKPLHCVAVCPNRPTLVACAGESEQVHVLRLPDTVPVAAVVQRQRAAAAAVATSSTGEDAAEPKKEEQQQQQQQQHQQQPNPASSSTQAATGPKQQNPDDIPALKKWTATALLNAHQDTITRLAFSPTGTMLAAGAMDGKVSLWKVEDIGKEIGDGEDDEARCTRQPHKVLDDHAGSEIESLLWHPSGAVICAGSTNAQIVMWNANTGAAAQYFSAHRDAVTCMAWTTDVKKLISASADGSIVLSNPKTGVAEATLSRGISRYDEGAGGGGMAPAITCIEVIPSVDPLVLVGLVDGTVALVSLKEDAKAAGKGRLIKRAPELHDQTIEALVTSHVEVIAAQRLVASCSCDCKVVLWSVPDLAPRNILYAGEGVMKVAWFNTLVLAACTDGDVRVWEGRTVSPQAGRAADSGGAAAIAAAAAASAAGAVTPALVQLMGHRRLVLDMEIARTENGAVLVTVADDGSCRAFSLVTQ